MKKQTKVLVAAAMLTLGASFSAMAAEKGTWQYEDGEWYCYDEDGEVYENEWCLYNGKEYYVGDDGVMLTSSWVDDGDEYYYVSSSGEKVVNDWKLLVPYDDEEADEEYFYFGSKGVMVSSDKKLIDGHTYYFDADGQMLKGWIKSVDGEYSEAEESDSPANATLYYLDETGEYTGEIGARVGSEWIVAYAPGVDPEEDDVDEDDMNDYYIQSSGKPKTGKASSIGGLTYFFDADGKMLSGWVAKLADGSYEEINDSDDKTIDNYTEVYFCGDASQGYAKKNQWIYTYANYDYDEDDADNDMYYFWTQKDGTVYMATSSDAKWAEATPYDLDDGEAAHHSEMNASGDAVHVAEKKIDGEWYLFNAQGEMQSNLWLFEEGMYYYGGSSDGAKKDGSVVITDDVGDSYKFYFSTETSDTNGYYDYAGVTGAKNGKLYENGLLMVAKENKYEEVTVTIRGTEYTFIVNKSGSIQTSDKEYTDDGETVINAENYTFNTGAGATKGSIVPNN